MTDAVDRHIDSVRELTRRGGPLDPRGATASINNPAWFRPDGTATSERRRLHRRIVSVLFAEAGDPGEPDRHAMVLAGPPGAGKSTLRQGPLEQELGGHVSIDVDDIKTILLRDAVKDESLEGFLKPQAVKSLEAQGERFFPLEMSALVHMEAAQIGLLARTDAMREGRPLVIDGVLSQPQEAVRMGEQFSAAGYDIDVVSMDVPFEVSEHNIRDRWRSAYEKTMEGSEDLLGGRWVPSDYARAMFDGPDGRSRSAATAEQMSNEVGAVSRYRVFSASSVGAEPQLSVDLRRTRKGGPLVDRETAEAHQVGRGRPGHLMRAERSSRHTDLDR